jgi:hypothetical protein
MSLADDITDLAHKSAADAREIATKMVNAVIVSHEQHGLDAVSLDMMRVLANAISTIPIVSRQKPAA